IPWSDYPLAVAGGALRFSQQLDSASSLSLSIVQTCSGRSACPTACTCGPLGRWLGFRFQSFFPLLATPFMVTVAMAMFLRQSLHLWLFNPHRVQLWSTCRLSTTSCG